MNRKALLARVYVETAPWHSVDGWWCEQEEQSCGSTEDELCPCCTGALAAVAAEVIANGGLL